MPASEGLGPSQVASFGRRHAPHATADAEPDLFDLSLEELAEVSVTSVAGKPQDWFSTPAAITVITGEQLRRSGHRSLAEALRLSAGVHIGRVDSRQWAVSVRGFANLFSNSLQVLIDGRVIYNELFGGVFWDVHQPNLEDVDRIEIIRGPGSTLWGANAVSGVVNVVTRRPAETHGTFLEAGGGNEERGFADARYGGRVGEDTDYRVWARYLDRDSTERVDNGRQRPDDWNLAVAGFDVEKPLAIGEGLRLRVQGQAHTTDHLGQGLPGPGGSTIGGDSKSDGGHVLARLTSGDVMHSGWQLQTYYDIENRRGLNGLGDRRDTVDVDYRQHHVFAQRHHAVWGAGYRFRRTEEEDSSVVIYKHDQRDTHLVTGFLQDTYSVVEDRVFVMLGSKIEHNDFSGFEIQPSGRLWWTPNERTTLWAAISRPVRTPTVIEEDITFLRAPLPPVVGTRGTRAEKLLAYELGFRHRITPSITFDLATFYNDHDDLIIQRTAPSGVSQFVNGASAKAWGAEVELTWQVIRELRLSGSYSYYEMRARNAGGTAFNRVSPRHQFQLHSQLDLPHRVSLDAALYYAGRTQGGVALAPFTISDWFRVDLGITWRPTEQIELAIVGQNLNGDHVEYFQSGRVDSQPEIERAVYGRLGLRF